MDRTVIITGWFEFQLGVFLGSVCKFSLFLHELFLCTLFSSHSPNTCRLEIESLNGDLKLSLDVREWCVPSKGVGNCPGVSLLLLLMTEMGTNTPCNPEWDYATINIRYKMTPE